MTSTRIADLPRHRQELAWSIISNADLPVDEDCAIREAAHNFEEGIGWGLALTLASIRGCTFDEAYEALG